MSQISPEQENLAEQEKLAEAAFARRLIELYREHFHESGDAAQFVTEQRIAENTDKANFEYFLLILSCKAVFVRRPSCKPTAAQLATEFNLPVVLRSDAVRAVHRARRLLLQLVAWECDRRYLVGIELAKMRAEGTRAGSLRN